MTDSTAGEAADDGGDAADDGPDNLAGSTVIAVVVGVALAWPARSGALQLLVAVAVLQALFALSWVVTLRIPGRKGALVISALSAAAADVAVSVWPHGRLGTLAVVFALAMPVLFVHQLARGTARIRVRESLGGTAIVILAVVSLPALLQLRHQLPGAHLGGDVAFAVAVVGSGALVVGFLVDLTFPGPRFDADVPRGLIGVVASTAVGAGLGQLTLRNTAEFVSGRGVFVGAALGALVSLFAVAAAFLERGAPLPETGFGRRARPVVSVLLPLCLLAPVAFLLCLAVRA